MLGGLSVREAAGICGVAPATAHRWLTRWREAPEADRLSLACFADRSSRPKRMPRRSGRNLEQRILEASFTHEPRAGQAQPHRGSTTIDDLEGAPGVMDGHMRTGHRVP
jgi:transposase